MTQQEFISIASYLRTAYPTSNFLPTQESVKTWYEDLKDLDSQTCKNAMREYVRNNDFPPSIAAIRKGCTLQTNTLAKPWNEAWDKVMIAVKKHGQYGAVEAMNSLDELTRKSVKAIGFYEICTSPNTSSLRREFKEIYEQYKHEHDYHVQGNDSVIGIQEK